MPETATRPTVRDLADRLRVDPSADGLPDCLAAALDAQAARCQTEPYTVSLREAALRRAVREWASRAFPLGVAETTDMGAVRVGRDPLITELEAPHRRETLL